VDADQRPYFAQLRRRDLNGLPSDLDAVRQMLGSRGWQLVDELLDQAHGDAVSRLLFAHTGSEGRVLDQAEYARLLGFLAGLRQARVAAESVIAFAERTQHKED
jgi:hypothetical protein